MMSWKTTVAVCVGIGITLASGWLQGTMTQRWGFDERMQVAVDAIDFLPEQLGDWQQEQDYEISESAIELLNCQAYLHRGYRNLKGDFIKLAVMVGPGSKMSIHIPEICFEASNYTLIEERQPFEVEVDGVTHRFWGVVFKMNDVTQRKLRVLYGWSEGHTWLAPEMPRWTVAGAPVLHKLQLSHTLSGASADDPEVRDAVTRDFLQQVVRAFGANVPARKR